MIYIYVGSFCVHQVTIKCCISHISSTIYAENNYVGLPYHRAEMYANCIACCPLVSHGMRTSQTDRRTDARPLYYPFC